METSVYPALETLAAKGCLFFTFPAPCAAKHDVGPNEACMFCPAGQVEV